MKALVAFAAFAIAAGCAPAENPPPAPVVASFDFQAGELDCPLADEKRVYDPDLDFPLIASCYWRCATGYEQDEAGALLLLLVDDALAAWRPQEPRLTVMQDQGCSP